MPMQPANVPVLPKPDFVIGGNKTAECSIGGYDDPRLADKKLTCRTPLAGKRQTHEAGIPAGIITPVGAAGGEMRRRDQGVGKARFTGGGHTALSDLAAARNNLLSVGLGLSGKSARLAFAARTSLSI